MSEPLKLHIGGTQAKPGWKILNIAPGPDVDFVGSCTDLSAFGDATVDEVYGSHVIEHLKLDDARLCFKEIARVLKPGGLFKGSVPDFGLLCRLYLELDQKIDAAGATEPTPESIELFNDQLMVLYMVYGGHIDEFDVHHFGYNVNILSSLLSQAGFAGFKRVDSLGEFIDTSEYKFRGTPISLNFMALR